MAGEYKNIRLISDIMNREIEKRRRAVQQGVQEDLKELNIDPESIPRLVYDLTTQ